MSQLVTLSKSSPEFESYLLGTFSKDQRALPVQTLNVNSASETVTFRIVPVDSLQRPSFFAVFLQTFKVKSFLLILVPLFLVLTINIADSAPIDPQTTVLATVGVLLAFVAVNLRNDYMDHMKGVDRVLEKSGSRAIQNGWVTAAQVKFYSSVLLALAILCAIPIAVALPEVVWVLGASVAVGLWAQFKKQNSFKYRIGGELALFLMFGPFLTVGYQQAMGLLWDAESVALGCLWGWLVLFVVHLKNFANILPSAQAGFTNTINWLGFDKSRRLLAFWWGAFVFFNLVYHGVYAGQYWGFYASVVLIFLSFSFIARLKNISSPAGSELQGVYRSGFKLFLTTIGLWVFECLWYLLQ